MPYYAGSKYIFYRKDLFKKAGLEVPTTMDEFVDAAIALKQANPKPANFSGFWFPGQDWRNGAAFVWDAGGDLATEADGELGGSLASPESVAGLETAQKLFIEASGAPKDGNEADPWTPFCAGEVGMMSTPGWVKGLLEDPETGCPDTYAKEVGVFALPGSGRLARSGAARWLGHRDRVEVGQPGLAQEAVALMLSEDYQTIMAERRAHAGPDVAGHRCSVTTSTPRPPSRPPPTPSSPRPLRAGPTSRAPGSWRTCSARSPRVATSTSWPPRPTTR